MFCVWALLGGRVHTGTRLPNRRYQRRRPCLATLDRSSRERHLRGELSVRIPPIFIPMTAAT
jgi:hypothetical protein